MRNLAAVLRKWRLMNELGVRDAAKELGLDHATLHRLERGYTPSGPTLAIVLKWLLAA